jgi:hypothetical protein
MSPEGTDEAVPASRDTLDKNLKKAPKAYTTQPGAKRNHQNQTARAGSAVRASLAGPALAPRKSRPTRRPGTPTPGRV